MKLFTLLLLIPTMAYGKTTSKESPSIVRTLSEINDLDETMWSNGSGVLIGKDKVLTCKHVVRGPLKVIFSDGTKVKATPIKISLQYDLCLLKLEKEVKFTPRHIRKIPLKSGEKLYAYGYGGGEFGVSQLTFRSKFYGGNQIVHGDSGGPILDKDGNVAGVISETEPGRNIVRGYSLKYLRNFLFGNEGYLLVKEND